MPRIWTRLIGRILIVAFLAAQGMLSAHACGSMGAGSGNAIDPLAVAITDSSTSGSVADCETSSPVCQKHCEKEPGTTDPASPATFPVFLAIFQIQLEVAARALLPARSAEPALSHATSPPTAICHCCWRI
ncbi:MAG: hypothetical protein JNK75_14230 [Betaproteobacteria bacterium]|nr:hypothetical protein [Betaproteobacteria bacterium]